MNNTLIKTYLVVLASIFSISYCNAAPAADNQTIDELSMKTDVGEVVLTVKPCTVPNTGHFEYEAYASEGEIIHKGCWTKEDDIVSIWFHSENPQLVAQYGDYYFAPRKALSAGTK